MLKHILAITLLAIALAIMLFGLVPSAGAIELGSLPGTPTASGRIDSNGDGVFDTAIIATASGARTIGMLNWEVTVGNPAAILGADLDGDGIQEAVVIGDSIVAVGNDGKDIWRINEKGYSGAVLDINNDGKQEVAVGGLKTISVYDGSGNKKLNFTDPDGSTVSFLAATREFIVGAYRASPTLFGINFAGKRLWAAEASALSTISGLVAFDVESSGSLNGVAVMSRDGSVRAFSQFGESKGWTFKDTIVEEAGLKMNIVALDRTSTGKLDHVAVNYDRRVTWLNNQGAVKAQVSGADLATHVKALATIDLDGDTILDDLLISRERLGESAEKGTAFAYNALGIQKANITETGGVEATAIDYDGDGKADDIILANDFSKQIYAFIVDVEDTTTAAVPPTTTPAPTTTPPPTTPPPTTPPPQIQEMSVDAGVDRTVKEGEEVILTATATPSTVGGEIRSYLWTEGDAILGREKSIKRKFSPGVHEITIEVTDDQGRTASGMVKVTVEPLQVRVLTVDAGPDLTVVEGTSLTLTAAATTSEPGAAIIAYLWSEDGIVLGSTQSIAVTLKEGAHQITVTATESTGQKASDTLIVNVLPAPQRLPALDLASFLRIGYVLVWIAAAGVGVVILLFLREKILDILWERRKDFGE